MNRLLIKNNRFSIRQKAPRTCLLAALLCAGLSTLAATAQQAVTPVNDGLQDDTSRARNATAWRPGDPIPPDARRLRNYRAPASDVKTYVGTTTSSAATVPVGVRRLDAADPDGAGIISARQSGLPDNFWEGTELDTALRIIATHPELPASAQVARRIIEAQLPPPHVGYSGQVGEFFAARVDQLILTGALPSAQGLLRGAGQNNPVMFQRFFDLSLLLGNETGACSNMTAAPGAATDISARIFCLAQEGKWNEAATVFTGAYQLNMIDPETADLLFYYLDDTSADSSEVLPSPVPMTPLAFRLHEAIGQPLPTSNLPVQYAWADLNSHSGWKAQLEAAERLSRMQALPPDTLYQLYISQRPAASGGVWERVAAIQALDSALAANNPEQIGAALLVAFRYMELAGLRNSFAIMFGPRLQPEKLNGEAARLSLWLRLWIGETEATRAPDNNLDAALLALASGEQPEVLSPALGALAPVFAESLPPAPNPGDGMALAPALYGALADADAGIPGDVTRAARGVRMLRQLGLIADARRVATQIALDPLLKEVAE